MKKAILIISALSLLLSSCGRETKNSSKKDSDSSSQNVDPDKKPDDKGPDEGKGEDEGKGGDDETPDDGSISFKHYIGTWNCKGQIYSQTQERILTIKEHEGNSEYLYAELGNHNTDKFIIEFKPASSELAEIISVTTNDPSKSVVFRIEKSTRKGGILMLDGLPQLVAFICDKI